MILSDTHTQYELKATDRTEWHQCVKHAGIETMELDDDDDDDDDDIQNYRSVSGIAW